MGLYKLIVKSMVFSTRSRRRFFTFVLVFSILSGATIVMLSFFDSFSREGMLDHRGVVVKVRNMEDVTLADAQADLGINDGERLPGSEAVIFYKYVNFGPNLRIFSVNTDYQWGFSEIKPDNLVAGRYPMSNREVLVSEEVLLALSDTQDGLSIYTKPVVGTVLKLGVSEDATFDLTISGIFKKPIPSTVESDTREWILLTEEAFSIVVDGDHLDYSPAEIYIYSISVLASGDIFSGVAYDNVDTLAAQLTGLDSNDYNEPLFTRKENKDDNRNMMFLSLLFGIFGTFMVSTLYSYLITRFRRREVAVLKAMGYGKWDVRIVVLAEILVVSISGFLIGLLAIQAYIWNPATRDTAYFYLIMFSPTAFWSFVAVVMSCVPGLFIITFRTLSVRPIEIFRQK